MSRPRLDTEHKRVSFSLAFSPNPIAALENVRGAKSQSVFVEEWLRQHPQIAAELGATNDPGFVPPVLRCEQLMERLLAFYSPAESTSSLRNPREAPIPRTLFMAQKAIIRHHESPEQEIQEQISAAMEAFWLQERRKPGERIARGRVSKPSGQPSRNLPATTLRSSFRKWQRVISNSCSTVFAASCMGVRPCIESTCTKLGSTEMSERVRCSHERRVN